MKVQLVYDEIDGKRTFCGYTMTAENDEDSKQLGIIRDYYFWKDLQYGGRKGFIDKPGIQTLGFIEKTVLPNKFDSIFDHINAKDIT